MCEKAKRVALLAVSAVTTAIAASGLGDDVEVAASEGDRLLTIDEAATRTGLSKDQLYRRKDLPFRVKVGPAQVRFSETGIEKWVRAKMVRPAV
jgi:excisionase family DNA binding protein